MKLSKMTTALALALLGCAALAGNTRAEEEEKKTPAPEVKKLAEAHNKFGLDMFKKLHKSGENTFISPTSIAVAMQMARQGAEGTTQSEMDTAMHLDGIDVPRANKALLKELNSRDGVKLRIANSLWADPERVNLKPEYTADVSDYFDSEARAVDFEDPETLKLVNNWISDKTEQLIPNMLNEISRNDILFLINAIYFKGEWKTKFNKDDTREADWHNADGTTKRHKLMSRTDEIAYGLVDGHQVARLPYGKDQKASMLIVLPSPGAGMHELISGLSVRTINAWTAALSHQEGTLELPRFEMKYKETLNDSLKQMGIESAFSERKADFTRMGEGRRGPIFIGRVLHEARVIVNEEGTEAAAATIVGMTDGESVSPPPFSMVCDRPFLFLITDEPTGAVLFMGTVYKPEDPTR